MDNDDLHTNRSRFGKKLVCLVLLLIALFIIKEEETEEEQHTGELITRGTRFAVWIALERHKPSARIYRGLFELNLLFWGGVFSLYVWYRYLGKETVSELLFAEEEENSNDHKESDNNDDGFGIVFDIIDEEEDEDDLFGDNYYYNDNDTSSRNVDSDNNDGNQDSNIISNTTKSSTDDDDNRSSDIIIKQEKSPQAQAKESEMQQKEQHNQSAPTMECVATAALDMLIAILLSLFFFTISSAEAASAAHQQAVNDEEQEGGGFEASGGINDDTNNAATNKVGAITTNWIVSARMMFGQVAAPIFPLFLIWYFLFSVIVPWEKRKRIWKILSYTMGAPLYDVKFRDGFVGDVLTSSVRPMQDVAFTLCYVLSGLQGWWPQSYFNSFSEEVNYNMTSAISLPNDDSSAVGSAVLDGVLHTITTSVPERNTMETSWLLHTVLLPTCMVSPLWWRFLQNLKQCYDNKKRWPYLGNALKYFVAAEVAMFGLFDPSKKDNFSWIACFVFATMYQVYWDVVMDWELLDFSNTETAHTAAEDNNFGNNDDGISSSKTTSKTRWLRQDRLYPSRSAYWLIFGVNLVLRFCWTLSFLPTVYLTKTGVLNESFQAPFANAFLNPALASAEIIRRTLWGLLRVEAEVVKKKRQQKAQSSFMMQIPPSACHPRPQENNNDKRDDFGSSKMMDAAWKELELQPMSVSGGEDRRGVISSAATINNNGFLVSTQDMATLTDLQVLMELSLYATAFTCLGIMAAYHRVTL